MGPHFCGFGMPKGAQNGKGENMKHMFSLMKIDVFKASGLPIRHENLSESGIRVRSKMDF